MLVATPAGGPEVENHQVIGHALFALAFGLAGAVAARRVFARPEAPAGRR